MNGRVSKFIRRWSIKSNVSERQCKRAWNGLPRPERAKMMARLKSDME